MKQFLCELGCIFCTNKSIHMEFLGLEKAFDRIPHELIWLALQHHGVTEAYVQYVGSSRAM